MRKIMIATFILFTLMNAPQQAFADESLWEKAKAGTSSVWERSGLFAAEITGWTVVRYRQAWDTTRDAAGNAVAWTGKKTMQGWHATREVAKNIQH